MKDFIVDHYVNMLTVTETWLRPGNIDEVEIGTFCPTGYRFLHVLRSESCHDSATYSNGGGVVVLF